MQLTRVVPLRVAGFEVDVVGLVGFVSYDFEFLPGLGVAQECLTVFFAGDPGCGLLRDIEKVSIALITYKSV